MSATHKDIVINVRQWIERAREDLRLSNHAMTMSTAIPYRLVAYHAQQCAEKCREAVVAISIAERVLKTVTADLKAKKFL